MCYPILGDFYISYLLYIYHVYFSPNKLKSKYFPSFLQRYLAGKTKVYNFFYFIHSMCYLQEEACRSPKFDFIFIFYIMWIVSVFCDLAFCAILHNHCLFRHFSGTETRILGATHCCKSMPFGRHIRQWTNFWTCDFSMLSTASPNDSTLYAGVCGVGCHSILFQVLYWI